MRVRANRNFSLIQERRCNAGGRPQGQRANPHCVMNTLRVYDAPHGNLIWHGPKRRIEIPDRPSGGERFRGSTAIPTKPGRMKLQLPYWLPRSRVHHNIEARIAGPRLWDKVLTPTKAARKHSPQVWLSHLEAHMGAPGMAHITANLEIC